MIPTVIDKTNQHEHAYDIFSRLLEERIIILTGEINDHLASSIVAQLLYLESKSKTSPIYMYINSPGGSISAGLAIYDTMNFIACDVSTIAIGICASMAAFLLSSGKTGQRLALPNSEVMIHQPLGGFNGQASDIEISANRILKQKEHLNQILASNTHQNIEKIRQDTDRDYFMDAYEALDYGIIDEIIQ
ncbi:MAG: ATP-dependent Clp protease proteolytic subunit [Erysipelotrichaceae bacterium]|nr:ATP-dependent Clp protease proteolytic subunit [Erysipelotrichaceae bacterium]